MHIKVSLKNLNKEENVHENEKNSITDKSGNMYGNANDGTGGNTI